MMSNPFNQLPQPLCYDLLCAIVERHAKFLFNIVGDARLFLFPWRAHEILPDSLSLDDSKFLEESFFLPFPIVAIEDTASCVILSDTEHEQRGINSRRIFIECRRLDEARFDEYRQSGPEYRAIYNYLSSGLPRGSCMIVVGHIDEVRVNYSSGGTVFHVGGGIIKTFVASKDSLIEHSDSDVSRAILRDPSAHYSSMISAKTALEEVYYLNSPSHFVVSRDPKKLRKVPAFGEKQKLPRSHQKVQYTLLRPGRIHEMFGHDSSGGSGGSVRPHERRRHIRTLRSERFTKSRGKSIIVPATWVGSSESVIGNRRYKVCLDL